MSECEAFITTLQLHVHIGIKGEESTTEQIRLVAMILCK